MKIAFHSNQLGIRGTEVALYDYALGNRDILGNESIIISDVNSDLTSLEKFKAQFPVYLYENFSEVEAIVDQERVDAIYYIKAGSNDGKLVSNAKNLVHTVFQINQPHGDNYAFIAQWLSKKMTGDDNNYVPHILSLPNVTQDYREFLNIPQDAIVFGRHGGYNDFDYEWSGVMGMNENRNPIIGWHSDRVCLAVRMGGMGVALSSWVADEVLRVVEKDLGI
jgi:hypothetical protein